MSSDIANFEDVFAFNLSLNGNNQYNSALDSDLVAVLRQLNNNKLAESNSDSRSPSHSGMSLPLIPENWYETSAPPTFEAIVASLQPQPVPDPNMSLEVFQHLQAMQHQQQQARQLQQTQQQLQYIHQQQQLQALQQNHQKYHVLQQQMQLQQRLTPHMRTSESLVSSASSLQSSRSLQDGLPDEDSFAQAVSEISHLPSTLNQQHVNNLNQLPSNQIVNQVNSQMEYLRHYAPHRSWSASTLGTNHSGIMNSPLRYSGKPEDFAAAASNIAPNNPLRKSVYKSGRNAPRKSVSHIQPLAPTWADASWHPMKAVISNGQSSSAGTGVFLPGLAVDQPEREKRSSTGRGPTP